jgi:hypothetical protein
VYPLVLLPIALVAERLGAHAAGEGLLPVVLTLVLNQVGGTVEAFKADGAHMFPARKLEAHDKEKKDSCSIKEKRSKTRKWYRFMLKSHLCPHTDNKYNNGNI